MHGEVIKLGEHCSNNTVAQCQYLWQFEENSFVGKIKGLYPAVKI